MGEQKHDGFVLGVSVVVSCMGPQALAVRAPVDMHLDAVEKNFPGMLVARALEIMTFLLDLLVAFGLGDICHVDLTWDGSQIGISCSGGLVMRCGGRKRCGAAELRKPWELAGPCQ